MKVLSIMLRPFPDYVGSYTHLVQINTYNLSDYSNIFDHT